MGDRENQEMMRAALNWGEAAVREALEAGADPNAAAGARKTALHLAAERGATGMALAVLDAGGNMELRDIYGRSALMLAAQGGHKETMRLLIERGADLEAQDHSGRSALHWAVFGENKNGCALELLEAGARADAEDLRGRTAKMLALAEDLGEVARDLGRWEAQRERKELDAAAGTGAERGRPRGI